MIEIKNLAHSAVVYGIGNGLSRFASLLALPFLTRYIAPSDYAIISLATLMCVVLRIGFGATAAAGIEYFKTEDQDERQNVIVALLAIALTSSLLMLAGGGIYSRTNWPV